VQCVLQSRVRTAISRWVILLLGHRETPSNIILLADFELFRLAPNMKKGLHIFVIRVPNSYLHWYQGMTSVRPSYCLGLMTILYEIGAFIPLEVKVG
jgi:hypothetical protein